MLLDIKSSTWCKLLKDQESQVEAGMQNLRIHARATELLRQAEAHLWDLKALASTVA
jgi:hypothetical protein